jgi:hypothetical protein
VTQIQCLTLSPTWGFATLPGAVRSTSKVRFPTSLGSLRVEKTHPIFLSAHIHSSATTRYPERLQRPGSGPSYIEIPEHSHDATQHHSMNQIGESSARRRSSNPDARDRLESPVRDGSVQARTLPATTKTVFDMFLTASKRTICALQHSPQDSP